MAATAIATAEFNPANVRRERFGLTGEECVPSKDYDRLLTSWQARGDMLAGITGDVQTVANVLAGRKL